MPPKMQNIQISLGLYRKMTHEIFDLHCMYKCSKWLTDMIIVTDERSFPIQFETWLPGYEVSINFICRCYYIEGICYLCEN